MEYPLCRIKWADSTTAHGWHKTKDVRKWNPHVLESTGYLIDENSDRLILAGAVDTGLEKNAKEQVNSIQIIPRGCIISRELVLEIDLSAGSGQAV